MSSFLAATFATFAQPTFFESRPSEKNRSTTGLAKLWIATGTYLTGEGIPVKGIALQPSKRRCSRRRDAPQPTWRTVPRCRRDLARRHGLEDTGLARPSREPELSPEDPRHE